MGGEHFKSRRKKDVEVARKGEGRVGLSKTGTWGIRSPGAKGEMPYLQGGRRGGQAAHEEGGVNFCQQRSWKEKNQGGHNFLGELSLTKRACRPKTSVLRRMLGKRKKKKPESRGGKDCCFIQ